MANKRQIKKFIREACGTLALEIIMAREAFPEIDRKAVHNLILKIARFQTEYLRATGIGFDHAPADFENRQAYNKAKEAYFRSAFTKLEEKFYIDYSAIIAEMNSAMPQEVRDRIKQLIAE